MSKPFKQILTDQFDCDGPVLDVLLLDSVAQIKPLIEVWEINIFTTLAGDRFIFPFDWL